MRDSALCPSADDPPASLTAVLAHDEWREWLLRFAGLCHGAENVQFLVEAEALMREEGLAELRPRLRQLVELYVAPGAPREINVVGTTRDAVIQLMHERDDVVLRSQLRSDAGPLRTALKEIEHVTMCDLFPEFSTLLDEARRERRALNIVREVQQQQQQHQHQQQQPSLARLAALLRHKSESGELGATTAASSVGHRRSLRQCSCCNQSISEGVVSLACRKCRGLACKSCLRKGLCHTCCVTRCDVAAQDGELEDCSDDLA